jgi:hypothetical protein
MRDLRRTLARWLTVVAIAAIELTMYVVGLLFMPLTWAAYFLDATEARRVWDR